MQCSTVLFNWGKLRFELLPRQKNPFDVSLLAHTHRKELPTGKHTDLPEARVDRLCNGLCFVAY